MSLTRRSFLQKLIASGLFVWLPGCGNDSPTFNPTQATALDDLTRRIAGPVLVSTDPRYAPNTFVSNLRAANIKPLAVALCTTAEDVRQCILWARENRIQVVPRSGGHSYGGFSATLGLSVSTRLMNQVTVDTGTGIATVGAGAVNTEIYNGLEPFGVAIPAGRCPTVAAGGLTLGGGFGFSSRVLGLCSDNLVESEIVTAEGQIRTISKTSDSLLFWACQGGGGGNFGINTRFKFKTAPVNRVTYFRLAWDWAFAVPVLSALQQVARTAPKEFCCRAGVGVTGPFGRKGASGAKVNMLGQYFGPEADLRALLAPVLAVAAPTENTIQDLTFWEAKERFYDTTPLDAYAVKSAYANTTLSDEALRTLTGLIEQWPGSTNTDGAGMAMFLWGGQLNVPAPDATAFVHRSAVWLLAMDASWELSDPNIVVDANLAWLQSLFKAMQPFTSGFSYQNFIDPDLPNFLQAYYGANLPRLVQAKQTYDPENFFRFPQSIPLSL